MSEIERARANLKISGYIHPKNTLCSKNKKYKTFNSDSTDKEYKSSAVYSGYAKFTDYDINNKNTESMMICPVCKTEALYECSCKYKDKQCVAGHVWYINEDNKIMRGDPH